MSNQYQRNKRVLLKEKCLRYLGGKRCRYCGIDYLPLRAYHFHHRNNKDFDISYMISRNMKWKDIKRELDKCVVLCSNDHWCVHDGVIDPKIFW